MSSFMDLATAPFQQMVSLYAANHSTAVWDPSTCPRSSSCSIPNRLPSWSEVVVRGRNRDSGRTASPPRLSLSNHYMALVADTPALPAAEPAAPACPDMDPLKIGPADTAKLQPTVPSTVSCSISRPSRQRLLREAVFRHSRGNGESLSSRG
ncbi:hypothetical protein JOB18_038850 [Solea senegalensis]|uniref:Uncharacterized protein n=1 Tax=Solea senegalensis TaxID=28829 RepID=A0AAV6SNH0_SOLSE|nr:hypothetical protein JOB18_038850 [Solea senegalensis]